jgi:hypothetical protein
MCETRHGPLSCAFALPEQLLQPTASQLVSNPIVLDDDRIALPDPGAIWMASIMAWMYAHIVVVITREQTAVGMTPIHYLTLRHDAKGPKE